MKILALEIEKHDVPPDQFAQNLKAEAMHVWSLYESGIVRELYFRQDRSDAVLILECADAAEAQAHLDRLPLVQAGLISFDLIPLIPYSGFTRLFS